MRPERVGCWGSGVTAAAMDTAPVAARPVRDPEPPQASSVCGDGGVIVVPAVAAHLSAPGLGADLVGLGGPEASAAPGPYASLGARVPVEGRLRFQLFRPSAGVDRGGGSPERGGGSGLLRSGTVRSSATAIPSSALSYRRWRGGVAVEVQERGRDPTSESHQSPDAEQPRSGVSGET